MTWGQFYLVCFVVGFLLTVIAFLGGVSHWPFGHHVHFRSSAHRDLARRARTGGCRLRSRPTTWRR